MPEWDSTQALQNAFASTALKEQLTTPTLQANPNEKKLICLDFDGVIHSYTSGWKGIDQIPDAPVEGAFQFITDLLNAGHPVSIHSSRSSSIEGIAAMSKWFREHGFDRVGDLGFPSHKPPAFLTIDDRAVTFTGTFPALADIQAFKPWNK